MRTPALILVALLAAACSSGVNDSPATSGTLNVATCDSAVKEGATVTDELIEKGCTDSNGATRRGTTKQCKNGQKLWEMGNFMGLSGETMIPANRKKDGLPARELFNLACVS